MNNEQRSNFTGKLGFVLAAAGSAVGLGNIWRFPYLAAKYGGGIFLLVYIILALTFGFALMTAEIAIGRKTGLSAIGAFNKLNKKYSFVGYMASIIPAIILSYYCVIGGWVMKYMAAFVGMGGKKAAAEGYFGEFISQPLEPMMWFLIYIGITTLVVLFGVEKGIEKASKFMMPILIILSVVIAGYVIMQPGAMEGVKFYLIPDFSSFSVNTVLGAMGQMFYSMSLAMGIMITYGSYMKKEVNLESSVKQIEFFDTGVAILAGLMIIPAVFASTGAAPQKPGPSLMFEALPKVFEGMTGGAFIGMAFFIMVFFAALTSSISLMETVVSIVCDKFKMKRIPSVLIIFTAMVVLGIPSVLGSNIWADVKIIGMQFLDFFDFISNNVLMPIVAFLTCIFVGYVIKPKAIIEEVEQNSTRFKKKKLFEIVIKYIAPICIVLILVSSLLDVFGIIKL